MLAQSESVLRTLIASTMFEVISARVRVNAQSMTDRVSSVQLLCQPHRLTTAWTRSARHQLGQQVSTDAVMLSRVATLLPAATLGVACAVACA
jgi:hypothetical protein